MLHNLPDDIVFEVVRHLQAKYLLNLELSNHSFRSLFVTDLWKRICESYLTPESVAKICDACLNNSQNNPNTQKGSLWKHFGLLCANFFQSNKQFMKCWLCNRLSVELTAVPLREIADDMYECRVYLQCKNCSIRTKNKILVTHFGCSECFADVAHEDLTPSDSKDSSATSKNGVELCECGSILRKWCCQGNEPNCECTKRCVHCEEEGLVEECEQCLSAYICPKCKYSCDSKDCSQYQTKMCEKCFGNHVHDEERSLLRTSGNLNKRKRT